MKTKTPTKTKPKASRPKTKLGPLQGAIANDLLPLLKGRPVATTCQISRISKISESTVRNAIRTGNIQQYRLPGGDILTDVRALITHFENTKTGRKPIVSKADAPAVNTGAFSKIHKALKDLISHAAKDLHLKD